MEYIIGDLRKDNALQASSEQIDNWKHFKSLFNINNDKLSFTEWIDLLDNGLGGLFFGKLKNKLPDQEMRAKIVVDLLLKYNLYGLCLFDGHGRMIYCIIKEFIARNINPDDYYFYIFDIHLETHIWHNEFFPMKNCCNINDNIFNEYNNSEKIYDHLAKDCLYYLNFCGLGDNHSNIKKFISNSYTPVILSCSRRCPNARKNETNRLIHNLRRISHRKMEKKCYLGLFETYVIENCDHKNMIENRGEPLDENRGEPLDENRGEPLDENRGEPLVYEIDKIIGNKPRHWLIKWKGYSVKEATYESKKSLRQQLGNKLYDELVAQWKC